MHDSITTAAEAGFLKVSVTRPLLVGWLHAAPTPARRWRDWASRIWHVEGSGIVLDNRTLAEAATLAEHFADNHRLLRHLIGDDATASTAAFDPAGIFLAGTMRFSDRPGDILAFLALARSLTDRLYAGHGMALVRNHMWSHGDPEATIEALLGRPFGERRDGVRIPAIAETRH